MRAPIPDDYLQSILDAKSIISTAHHYHYKKRIRSEIEGRAAILIKSESSNLILFWLSCFKRDFLVFIIVIVFCMTQN
jgi:hypothetical protein